MIGLALALAAASVAPRLPSGVPPLESINLDGRYAQQDLAFVALGMRRQAADLHFIRLLQYYGTPEGEAAEEDPGHGMPGHIHRGAQGEGEYPELVPRTLHILELDPYFRYATLYTAGALAFNMGKPEQAIALLRRALERDPKAWRYHLYIAAIAYRKDREFGKLVVVLEPAIGDPECPAMLKLIVAGIYQKLGRPERARELYLQVEQDSRDPDSRRMAKKRRELLEK